MTDRAAEAQAASCSPDERPMPAGSDAAAPRASAREEPEPMPRAASWDGVLAVPAATAAHNDSEENGGGGGEPECPSGTPTTLRRRITKLQAKLAQSREARARVEAASRSLRRESAREVELMRAALLAALQKEARHARERAAMTARIAELQDEVAAARSTAAAAAAAAATAKSEAEAAGAGGESRGASGDVVASSPSTSSGADDAGSTRRGRKVSLTAWMNSKVRGPLQRMSSRSPDGRGGSGDSESRSVLAFGATMPALPAAAAPTPPVTVAVATGEAAAVASRCECEKLMRLLKVQTRETAAANARIAELTEQLTSLRMEILLPEGAGDLSGVIKSSPVVQVETTAGNAGSTLTETTVVCRKRTKMEGKAASLNSEGTSTPPARAKSTRSKSKQHRPRAATEQPAEKKNHLAGGPEPSVQPNGTVRVGRNNAEPVTDTSLRPKDGALIKSTSPHPSMIPRLKRSVSCATATPRGSADTVDGPRCPNCAALSIALEQQASELLEAHLALDNLGPASALAPRAVDLSEPLAGKVRRLSETVVRHQMELAALQSEQNAVHTKLASSNTTREGLEQLLKCTMTSLRLVEWSNSGDAPMEDPEGRIEVWKKRAIAAEETSRSYADYTSMLERDVAMLEQELSVAKESEARSTAVTNTETLEVQTLKRELKDANHEIKQLTAKVTEGAQLQIQLREAAASVETLKREIAEIMSETAKRGTEDSGALKEAKSEIGRLRSMLASREIEWAAKVDEAWRTVAESRCGPEVGRETAVLVGKLSEREREVETLQSRLLVSEERLQLMEKAGLRESTEFNSSSTIAHTDALRDMQKLRETVERLSHDLSNASRRAKCRNDENVCLKVQLSSCLQSMESLRAQLNTAKVTNADLLSKIQKLGQRKQDLTETRGQAGLDSSQSTPYQDLKEGLSRSSATGTTVDESKDNNKLGYPAGLDAPYQSRVIKDSQLFSASTTAIATFVCIYGLVIPLSIFNVLRMELPFAWRISVQLFGGAMAILIICRPRVDQ